MCDEVDRLARGLIEGDLDRAANLGFTDLITWLDGGGVPGERVLRSMRLFAREVMPALAGVGV